MIHKTVCLATNGSWNTMFGIVTFVHSFDPSVLAGLVLSPMIAMVVFNHSVLQGEKAGMMAGVITTAAIYQKVYSSHYGCAKQ